MEKEFFKQLLSTKDITIEKIGRWIWISGNTKQLKEELKKNNFKWSYKKQMWYYHKGKYRNIGNYEMTIEEIKAKYQSQTLRSIEVV